VQRAAVLNFVRNVYPLIAFHKLHKSTGSAQDKFVEGKVKGVAVCTAACLGSSMMSEYRPLNITRLGCFCNCASSPGLVVVKVGGSEGLLEVSSAFDESGVCEAYYNVSSAFDLFA
jgi:hypothetical protein